jgi:hypothetical protein
MTAWIRVAGCGCIAALAALAWTDRVETPDPRRPSASAEPARLAARVPAMPRRAHLLRTPDAEETEVAPESAAKRESAVKTQLPPARRNAMLGLGLLALLLIGTRKQRRASPAPLRA